MILLMIISKIIATPETNIQPVLRHSQRTKQSPDLYGERVNVSDTLEREPTVLEVSLQSSDKENWLEVIV